MTKGEFDRGSSTIDDFWAYIRERFLIHQRREAGNHWPWTENEILQTWSFTNVFREWDAGTQALHRMLRGAPFWQEKFFVRGPISINDQPTIKQRLEIARNIAIYRLWNCDIHADEHGWIEHLDSFAEYIRRRRRRSEKVFTSAYMRTAAGRLGCDKAELFLEASYSLWDNIPSVSLDSLRLAGKDIIEVFCVGRFDAQEIGQDWRYILGLLHDAPDTDTWCHTGPGCNRGLLRLGMPTGKDAVDSMRVLLQDALANLGDDLGAHFGGGASYPFFELHTIEFNLCEFDKYERVRLGQGRPRRRYRVKT